jgi:hypothetical protein
MGQQINLFNPLFLPQKKHFSAVAMAQSLAVVLASMVLLHIFASQQARALEKLLSETSRDAAQRREQMVALTKQYSARGTSKTIEDDIARVGAQLQRRNDLFAELRTSVGGNAGGFSPYLSALARRPLQGVWLTGLEIADRTGDVVIRGRALSAELVPSYVRNLSLDPAFAGRSVSSLQVTARDETQADARSGSQGQMTAQTSPSRYVEFFLSIAPGAANAAEKSPS